MDKKEVNEDKISNNFIFFDFRDFSFHNYGQMFPKEWYSKKSKKSKKEDDTSLNCSPDTDAAIQDALEEIIRDLSGEKIEERDIKLLSDNVSNNFNKFTTWLSKCKKIEEYEKYIKKNIKNFASKKHKESDELCNKVFESLFNPVNFHEFQENIKDRITTFLKKEGISVDDSNKKKYLFKYLNVLLRCIPQPWNALGSGALLKRIMNPKKKNKIIKYKHPAFYIKDMSKIKYREKALPPEYAKIVKYLQFYLEYALIINAPDKWLSPEDPSTPGIADKISMIVFPLLDNGFFRGYFYLLSSCPEQIKEQWNDPNIMKQNEEKCLYFVDSLRVAHETEMMDLLFREKKGGDDGTEGKAERDIYKRILKNLHYIQEVSLGSLWMIEGKKITQSYVTGYGRYFKGKPKGDKTPGIYWYREYKNYKNFIKTKCNIRSFDCKKIKKEEIKLAKIAHTLYCKNRDDFYREYPKFEVLNDKFNSQYIQASSAGSYYKQKNLGIKWRLTLPVVRRGDLKAIYFFYYRDPIVISNGKYTKLSKIKKNILQKEVFGLRARQIMKFFSAIEAYEERKIEIIKHGTRAAVAAIMGRNMDHNIGSHVLSYLVSDYSKLADELLEVNSEKINQPDIKEINNRLKERSDIKPPLHSFISNNRYLLKYLKDRMDFLATILTFIPSCTTLNFLQDVVGDTKDGCEKDVLNYGMHKETCFKKFTGCDNFKYFRPKNFILDYIAFSEKLKRDNISREKIVIKFNNILNGKLKDINVALPGGVVGKQAFYVIVENIIRNAAKHGTKNQGSLPDKLEFTIDFPDECSNNHVNYDKDELLRITITDNLENDKIADKLQGKCELPLIKEDGSLDRTDLGIKEKKIAAAFLRGCSPSSIEGNRIEDWQLADDSKNILEIIQSNSNLQYSFFLLKPKEILIITDNINGINHKIYKKEGIDFVITNPESARNGIMTVGELEERYKKTKLRYRFLLIVGNTDISSFDKDYLPYRIVTANNGEIKKPPIELIKWVYEEWLIKCKKSPLPSLVFYYDHPKSSWDNLYTKYDDWKNNNKYPVCIYFLHFETKVKEFINDCKKEILLECMEDRSVIHIESITGRNSSKSKIDDPQKPEIMKWEFIEAGLIKVLIIDERLFNIAANGELLKAKGIEIWDLKETENGLIFETLPINSQKKEIKVTQKNGNLSIQKENCTTFDFIAIHQGIIDKILDRNTLEKTKENIENVLNALKDLGKFKCVHSGRGKTEEIPEGWRFLNYPELESWFFDDKHTLVQGLFSLRGR